MMLSVARVDCSLGLSEPRRLSASRTGLNIPCGALGRALDEFIKENNFLARWIPEPFLKRLSGGQPKTKDVTKGRKIDQSHWGCKQPKGKDGFFLITGMANYYLSFIRHQKPLFSALDTYDVIFPMTLSIVLSLIIIFLLFQHFIL